MKTLFTVLALFCFTTLYAQPPGVKIPEPQPYLPPMWPNEPTWPRQLFKRNKTEIDRTHSFIINLKDSSRLLVEGMIMFDSTGYYLAWTDTAAKQSDTGRTKKIYPSQTLSLVRNDENTMPDPEGVTIGSAWLFPAIKGKLTVYTTAAEDDLPDESLLYIRKDDGPIQNLNIDMLQGLLKGDAKALQLLHKGKIRKAIEQYNELARFAHL
jgi:hypothetical protein